MEGATERLFLFFVQNARVHLSRSDYVPFFVTNFSNLRDKNLGKNSIISKIFNLETSGMLATKKSPIRLNLDALISGF